MVSTNARLVRHLMTTTADGIVPDLMAEDFSLGASGRAKTADFLGQLFRRDPAHSATADYPAEWRLDPSTAGP